MNEHDYERRVAGLNKARANAATVDEDNARTYLNRVYAWMAGALVLTAATSWGVFQHMTANLPTFNNATGELVGGSIFWHSGPRLFMIVVQLALVIYFSLRIAKMSKTAANVCFLFYAALTGVTLAPIFLCYTHSSIQATFLAAAGTFAAVSLLGYLTKMDLTGIGSFCLMGLFGIVIAYVINMFVHSEGLDKIITYIGVFVFIGLTAWDTQKLKKFGSFIGNGEDGFVTSDEAQKFAVFGALQLYLDFINLFLYLLRIFGDRGRR